MMITGEPLQNYENVKKAVLFMIDDQLFSLSSRQVTVSTVGVVKNMYRLTDDVPHINLALSLHAPNQAVRLKIVPSASAHPIEKLIEAITYHINSNEKLMLQSRPPVKNESRSRQQKRHPIVMIEYILIKDINDRPEHAHELGALLSLKKLNILLNLIPYNPTDVAEDYFPPLPEDVQEFSRICRSPPYDIHTRIRQEMGQDIAGACGQLALVNKSSVDIEDIGKQKGKSTTKVDDGSGGKHWVWSMALVVIPLFTIAYMIKRRRE